jgi:hypothetical protein
VSFANERGLLSLLLQAVLWVLDRAELFAAFVFPEAGALSAPQVLELLLALKQTLLAAARLSGSVDPLVLLPPAVLRRADRRQLADICLVLAHQIELGPGGVSLFEDTADKTVTVAALFAAGDFDRAFALARIFRVDVDEALMGACAVVAQRDEAALASFLFGVIPRLEIESANRLVEALASVLARGRASGEFVARIVAQTADLRNVFQILRWFGSREHAAVVGFACGFRQEIEELEREARRRKDGLLARRAARWLAQCDGCA